jgi:hypothetical protein
MSCLYSSPEVKRTKMKVRWERAATVSHAPIPVRAVPMMSSTVALNKNAFPTRQHDAGEPCFNLRLIFLRKSSSAKSGFRSLCGHKQRSSISRRAQLDQRLGTFQPVWLSLSRTAVPTHFMPGSCTGVVSGT